MEQMFFQQYGATSHNLNASVSMQVLRRMIAGRLI